MTESATTTRRPRFFRLRAIYRGAALLLLNLVVAFVAFNLILLIVFRIKDGPTKAPDPVSRQYGMERLRQVYPQYSEQEIQRLLAESWNRPHQFEPFTQYKERPCHGAYVNVHEAGFRENGRQPVWPPDEKSINIFVFGGSTTFGYGVADAETIPAQLEASLAGKTEAEIHVYNFGRGAYFSTQERILFEQLALEGYIPDVALFIDGLNDFGRTDGKPVGSEILARAIDTVGEAPTTNLVSRWPIGRLAVSVQRRWQHRQAEQAMTTQTDQQLTTDVVERYWKNVEIAAALGRSQNVATIFVWQPIPTYHYDARQYHLFFRDGGFLLQTIRAADGYQQMETRKERQRPDLEFLWLADLQSELTEPLYVDRVHYTAGFSGRIAEAIADDLLRRGVLKTRSGVRERRRS